jgi:hypothetical protein
MPGGRNRGAPPGDSGRCNVIVKLIILVKDDTAIGDGCRAGLRGSCGTGCQVIGSSLDRSTGRRSNSTSCQLPAHIKEPAAMPSAEGEGGARVMVGGFTVTWEMA